MFCRFRPLVLACAILAAACGRSGDGALEIAIIGSSGDLFGQGSRLSAAGQHVRAASAQGLVGLDAQGQVTPALADRWNVTQDGRSYIFRLRNGTWPDGDQLTGESVRDALRRSLARLSGTSLGLDLAQIAEVRAMAGRVVEIRLKGPMPDFLQLLAQPELALTRNDVGTGPMALRRVGKSAVLAMLSPEKRALPVESGWEQTVRELRVRSLSAKDAVALFEDGEIDIVLNGRIEYLPLADTGPLSRGTVRLDPAIGLFGLEVRQPRGLLADASGREALAMAIDRDGLIAPFNLGGWTPTTRLVAPGLPGDPGTIGERWEDLALEARRAAAARRVAAWKAANRGTAAVLTISFPAGPGSDLLFGRLTADFGAIGVELRRVKEGQAAHLALLDRVARYADARWFLNQLHCQLKRGLCSPEADTSAAEAMRTADPSAQAALLAQAEAEMTAANLFIPFGPPVRWSLVRGGVGGFASNRWVFHPLPQLATIPR